MTTLQRYVLFQVPGWVLALIFLAALTDWIALPAWAAVLLFFVWVIKDAVLYPFVRIGYEATETGIGRMIGSEAIVKEALDPEGYVTVDGELWQARIATLGKTIPPSSRVRVVAAQEMTLIVELRSGNGTPDPAVR